MCDGQLPFDFEAERREAVAEQHRAELGRVSERIAGHVCAFLRAKGKGGEFHAEELTAYVRKREQVAPDSPLRIMRDLRKRGVIGVKLLSRSKSLYQVGYVARRAG